MDSLIRQTMLRYSQTRQEKKEDSSSIGDQRTTPQKAPSARRVSFSEQKKTQNWFQRQFSRQTSQDYGLTSEEHAAAVAAAAFAINSLEELNTEESGQADVPLTKEKSRKADTTRMPSETGKRSRRFSGEPSKADVEVPGKRAPTSDEKRPEKAISSAPSMKKTPTFADSQAGRTSMKKQPTFSDSQLESKMPETALPKPDLPPSGPSSEKARQSPAKHGPSETQADAWEKAEMAKIKEKYDKLNATIREWEEKKKTKAKRRQSKVEDEIARKRKKAAQRHREEMERIEQIARGARAQAEQNRRNEEMKVKEKVNRIRETGKMPATCWCF
ncbi:hypothetical protein NMG60_11009302 [Bertholletia excelsa]